MSLLGKIWQDILDIQYLCMDPALNCLTTVLLARHNLPTRHLQALNVQSGAEAGRRRQGAGGREAEAGRRRQAGGGREAEAGTRRQAGGGREAGTRRQAGKGDTLCPKSIGHFYILRKLIKLDKTSWAFRSIRDKLDMGT